MLSDFSTVRKKAALVRLAVFDVDGVLTNGRIIYDDSGQELKAFHVQDGLGLKMLMQNGCEVAVITSRISTIVAARMAELGVRHVYQGQADKRACLLSLAKELDLDRDAIAYTGDDLIDLPAMRQCGLAVAVANAHPFVKANADWTTMLAGGSGAVREICDLILQAHGKLDALHALYLQR